MSILTEELPRAVCVDGKDVPIRTDFRVGIEFEMLMQREGFSAEEKVIRALSLYYPAVPENISEALAQMIRFYACEPAAGGAQAEDVLRSDAVRGTRRGMRAYCFERDAGLIFSAFFACYGMDLAEVRELHWWKFRALFMGLPADCRFMEVMGYRTADLSGMAGAQRKHYERMRRLYALPRAAGAAETISLAGRDREMREYVKMRVSGTKQTETKT